MYHTDAVSKNEKLMAAGRMRDHIIHVQTERDVNNNCVKRSHETYHLQDKFIHYTSDFSQNVKKEIFHITHDR
jgi:hypothetical protein